MVFVNGLDLGESFHSEVVRPILLEHFPSLTYSAGLIGNGSEILGFDTEMSIDHDWGPRMLLFIEENENSENLSNNISSILSQTLPSSFRSFPTSFLICEEDGVQVPDKSEDIKHIIHRVKVTTMRKWFLDYINFDIMNDITTTDWLSFPQQKLRTIIEGRVFHDDLGLNTVRSRFSYYPEAVWKYQLAANWVKIEEEEHLMGRCGSVNDDLGSALVATRLVRSIMLLCFQMERQYSPYMKWFGSAFQKLHIAHELQPLLNDVIYNHTLLVTAVPVTIGGSSTNLTGSAAAATTTTAVVEEKGDDDVTNIDHVPNTLFTENAIPLPSTLTATTETNTNTTNIPQWKVRQYYLTKVYECIARYHNKLQLTPNETLPEEVKQFHERPFYVMSMGTFSQAIVNDIRLTATATRCDDGCGQDGSTDNNISDIVNAKSNYSHSASKNQESVHYAAIMRILDKKNGNDLPVLGSLDMFCDNCALSEQSHYRHVLKGLYE